MPLRFPAVAASLLAVFLCLGGAIAHAQPGYPDHPVTLIVPFPAGGPSDALARAIASKMGQNLGQTIVIDNQGGANGLIGLSKAIKAAPDGYTLAFGGIGTHVANVALYKKLPYDPVADFQPIGPAGTAPLLLLARADLPVNDLPTFVAWLSQHREKASYGSAGIGSISHYGCVLLLSALQQNVTHIPYKGVAPAMNDLMGGQIDFMCDQTTTALPQIAGGRIKAIAVLSSTRIAALPAMGTATQAGYAMDVRSWNALFAPRGTPPAVMARLTQALQAAMADAGLRQQMQGLGVDLPKPAEVDGAVVSQLIADGIRRDVPALKAKGQYLD
jgi:tripartite-type tricarboxylate transporter receptor subunit TctC